jgi:methylated-DNA-[protein]-cysteine S-methyltransferase
MALVRNDPALEAGMSTMTLTTPIGPLTVIARGDTVLAAGFTEDREQLLGLMHPALRDDAESDDPGTGRIAAAVSAYFDGELSAIDAIVVDQRSGGDFLSHAWDVLRDIHAPVSYSEYARRAGRPAAVRAAAQACARNAAALFVPCHRVLRNDGSLGGYRYGLPVKRRLLDFEADRTAA